MTSSSVRPSNNGRDDDAADGVGDLHVVKDQDANDQLGKDINEAWMEALGGADDAEQKDDVELDEGHDEESRKPKIPGDPG